MTSTPTIVIIEDSPTQAKEIAAYLSQRNIDVLIATDGPQGLRLVYECRPNAVVLDVNLPTMSGHQVCHRLKRDPDTNEIPVIMVTSADGSEDALQGLDAGADDYIPKDEFVADNLLATIQSLGLIT